MSYSFKSYAAIKLEYRGFRCKLKTVIRYKRKHRRNVSEKNGPIFARSSRHRTVT